MTLFQTHSMTLSRQQLVSLLGMTESGFSRAQARLEEHDFPKRLPGLSKWSKPAVVAWIKANGNPDLMHRILIGEPNETEEEELSIPDVPADLAARYGGSAA
ncbi:hypothetical protein SAMN04488056_12310 [Cohaesibacter marisflavi]|uniref:Uncharacterized protein n=1 Tax=Cohaesibacter marisflavi TaxID=655353 RepID=A0A1I5MRT6_9HYPH|nr:hypothetical protein [Cohaesibacter marisflavi]SFP12268.1 hypothetical protein SAMN04488056_12310 [Cohaesibacter marisflavi]